MPQCATFAAGALYKYVAPRETSDQVKIGSQVSWSSIHSPQHIQYTAYSGDRKRLPLATFFSLARMLLRFGPPFLSLLLFRGAGERREASRKTGCQGRLCVYTYGKQENNVEEGKRS